MVQVGGASDGLIEHAASLIAPQPLRGVIWPLLIALVAIGLVILWNVQMRREVRERTKALQAEAGERQEAQKKLKQSEMLLKAAGAMARVGGWMLRVSDNRIVWSDEVCALFQLPPGATPSLDDMLAFVHADSRNAADDLFTSCIRDGVSFDEELRINTAEGEELWIRMIGQPLRSSDGVIEAVRGAVQDISRRKRDEEEIRHLALYDHLTGLPNRKLLVERLQRAIYTSTRTGRLGAVLFIDLDNFKSLNDTQCHDFGDQLLRQAGERLQRCVRKSDTVARWGSDEFIVILEKLSTSEAEAESQAHLVATKVLGAFQHPFQLDGYEHYNTASVGVALFETRQNAVETLLKRADLAMYQAKSAGRNSIRFFKPEMQRKAMQRAELEATLRGAIQRQEFMLKYQPQIGKEGRIVGVEALVRWLHPEKGMISPGDFIPVAEETGLILPLGYWVLETACHQLVAWSDNLIMQRLVMSVNVSARQFRHPAFLDEVVKTLATTGADPHRLKLEITESVLLDNLEEMVVKMNALKQRGISFAIDDFGTGYSSLSYLKRLPLDQLKIDQSFVRDVLSDPNDAIIARTIVGLGHSLGLDVIAEGVETEDQRMFLANSGCKAYQGYLFSEPLSVDKLEAFVLAECRTASIMARCR